MTHILFYLVGGPAALYLLYILNILIDEDDRIFKWYSFTDFCRWFKKSISGAHE